MMKEAEILSSYIIGGSMHWEIFSGERFGVMQKP